MTRKVVLFCALSEPVPYRAAWRWQRDRAAAVRAGGPEALALLQHPPVFTFGRRVRAEHLLVTAQELAHRGAEVIATDRGGDVTFHGPGQLVGYPILDLRARRLAAARFVCGLEEAAIRTLAALGIAAGRRSGRPGVWVAGDKVAAVGVHIRAGVSTHGLALNVAPDLSWFNAIVPCGLADAGVTSIAHLVGRDPGLGRVADAFCAAFEQVFGSELVPAPASGELGPWA